jgi:hypothetical protein
LIPERPARSFWLRNGWLLAAGLALAVPLCALGPERFVAFARDVYTTRIAQFSPEFRARLVREIQALYVMLVVTGVACVAAWAALSTARRDVLRWLLAERASDWRAVALLLVTASSSVFLAVRLVRDVARFEALRGLSFEEQRQRLAAESPIEPDYAKARAFADRNGPRPGNILILRAPSRNGAGQGQYLFLAQYLFPVRLYSGSQAELATGGLAERGIRWIQREDPQTGFSPEPAPGFAP